MFMVLDNEREYCWDRKLCLFCVCRRNWRVSWQLHVNRPTYIRRHSSTRMYACLLVHVVSEEEKAAFQIPRCSSGKDRLSPVAPGSIVMAASICSAKHLRIKLIHEVFRFSFLPSPFRAYFIVKLYFLRLETVAVGCELVIIRGYCTAVAQWLRCCSTNRKVAGSIPDGVFGIFHWHNPSDRTMALGSTQPLIEMSAKRYFLGVNAAGAYGWQPYHLPVPLSWNLGTVTSWNPLSHSRPVTGLICLTLLCKALNWAPPPPRMMS